MSTFSEPPPPEGGLDLVTNRQCMAFSVPRTGSLLIADWLRALPQDVVKIGYREKVHHS